MPSKAETIKIIQEDCGIINDMNNKKKVNVLHINFERVKDIIPQIYYSEDSIISVAEDILKGKLHTIPSIEPLECNVKTIDFSISHSARERSFQLYLQCLNPVMLLTKGHTKKKNNEYLYTAFDIIKQWDTYQKNNENIKSNKFIYVDHAVGRRVENLIYFGKIYQNVLGEDHEVCCLLENLYQTHGEWLAKKENYTPAHNHGIMEDEALLHLGYILNRNDWIELAKERLLEQEKAAFTNEFVHTENSAGYASMVATLFIKIGNFLLNNGDTDGQRFLDDMNKTKEYQNWVTMPNGLLAQIGDTSGKPGQLYGSEKQIQRKTQDTHKLYKESGYFFYRSNRNNSPKLDTWKMIKAGYTKTTHKHADDISFMLYSKGYEVFTDCGMYGYTTDSFREYFLSAKAHNTILVDNESYQLNVDNSYKTGIKGYCRKNNFDIVSVFNNQYPDVLIKRDFYSNGDMTILHDKMSSATKHIYSQLFHRAEKIKIGSRSKEKMEFIIADTGYRAIILQIMPIENYKVFDGHSSQADYGLISRSSSHCATTQTVKYDIKGDNSSFLTLICIVDPDGNVQLDGYKIPFDSIKITNNKVYSNEEMILMINDNSVKAKIEDENALDSVVRSVSYEFEGKKVKCKLNLNELKRTYEFAYYLVRNNEVIEKVMYSNDTSYEFEPTESGEYRLKYYIKFGDIKKSYLAPKIVL